MSIPKLEDYIITIPQLIPMGLCWDIICEYQDAPELVSGKRVDGQESTTRTCSEVDTSRVLTTPDRKIIDARVLKGVDEAVGIYKRKFPDCRMSQDTGYVYVQYKEGEFFKQHTDKFFNSRARSVTISIALNDDYEGGEWCWWDRQIVKKLATGDAVMFPSTWLFPHEILPVTRGTRHAMVTWFVE